MAGMYLRTASSLLMVCLFTAAMQTAPAHGFKMWVRIQNALPGPLTLHCYSRDDDLHQQHIPPGRQYFFDFNMNFWGTTDFWCRFNFGAADWQQFDVWTGPGFWGTAPFPCKQCLWVVKADGFYRTQEGLGNVPVLVHTWNLA